MGSSLAEFFAQWIVISWKYTNTEHPSSITKLLENRLNFNNDRTASLAHDVNARQVRRCWTPLNKNNLQCIFIIIILKKRTKVPALQFLGRTDCYLELDNQLFRLFRPVKIFNHLFMTFKTTEVSKDPHIYDKLAHKKLSFSGTFYGSPRGTNLGSSLAEPFC